MKIKKYELIIPLMVLVIFTLSNIINNNDLLMYILSIIVFPVITFFVMRFTSKTMLNDLNKKKSENDR